ncbi:hypothetical protein GN958_ATG02648 [Phytophthora infestans]|uniref:Uncharacterized protein n=1 Tax=Phytophthora infestans TaxID=4787 RepID=A0A8S9V4T8_PHYIN|nr:hypothetical protein GN958_ATG02648 [Phytophthora infestans]
MATEMTTTEETETTETVTSEDVRALAREDVSGDVTRSVVERGGYAVSSGLWLNAVATLKSSGCTSGAGTGSSKQTTETSGGDGDVLSRVPLRKCHRDDHDGGKRKTTETVTSEDVTALAREAVSGDVICSVAERVATLCHLAVRVARHGSSKQTTGDVRRRRRRFVEGTTTENGHRDDYHDGGNGKRRRQ